MKILPLDKKLVTAIGIAAGAGIALTLSYRWMNRRRRCSHRVKIEPKWVVSAGSSQSLLPTCTRKSESVRPTEQETPPPRDSFPAATIKSSEVAQSAWDAAPEQDRATRMVLSTTQRHEAAVLDVLVILFAFCLFFAIFQMCRASVRIDRFNAVVLTWSVVLIGIFYDFLFKMSGRDTAGQVWLKRNVSPQF